MIGARLPSLQKQYDEYWSGDSAFVQLADDATSEQIKERANRIRVARETGDWSPLVLEGQQPTKFILRPMPGDTARRLLDALTFAKLGNAKLAQVAFLAAIVSIENFGAELPAITRIDDPDYGPLADIAIANALDSFDLGIVGELGGVVLNRARGPSPKR